MKLLSVFALLLALAGYVGTSAQAQTPDSTRQLPVIRPGSGTAATDTLPPAEGADDRMEELVDSLAPAVDTVRVSAAAQAQIYKIVPRVATIRSAILPGWGQAYNRQYWKVPVVAAGFGTFAYIIISFTRNYRTYYDAYAALAPRDSSGQYRPVTDNDLRTITGTVVRNGEERPLSLGQIRQGVEFWRRWRDYNVIFTALFWGLNIVDANVSAHLKTFDVSDSLTLKYAPTVMPSTAGFVPGIKLTMTFRK